MILLIVSIITTIVFIIIFAWDGQRLVWSKRLFFAFLGLLICIPNFFTVVPPNNVGVIYSPFKGVSDITLPEGFHTKGFFDKVYPISTEVQTKVISGIYGQTKDAQYLTMSIDVKYRVNSANAFNVFRQFRTLNEVDKNLIAPLVQRSVEAVTTKYGIIEFLGEKRNEAYTEIEEQLRQRLAANDIDLHSITLSDTDAGEEIEKAIEEEAVARKKVETAQQERERAKIESEQRVIEAEANKKKAEVEAETQLVKARADAEASLVKAQAETEAYKILTEQLTDELIKKMWIDKWNGQMPRYVGGTDDTFLLDITD